METFSALLALCEIHRSQAGSPHTGKWHRALMVSLICAWTNGWAYNRDAGDLSRHRGWSRSLWRHPNKNYYHVLRVQCIVAPVRVNFFLPTFIFIFCGMGTHNLWTYFPSRRRSEEGSHCDNLFSYRQISQFNMMTSWHGQKIRITGPLCGVPGTRGQWYRHLVASLLSACISFWTNSPVVSEMRGLLYNADVTSP